MKSTLLFILLTPTFLFAQDVNFKWAKQMSGPGGSGGNCVITDTSGNIYSTGFFEGTVDFDPGPDNYYLTAPVVSNFPYQGSNAYYISKLDSSGNFIWAKQIQGLNSSSSFGISDIDRDAIGNIYATGGFLGTVDFDPGSAVYNLTSLYYNAFVLKLDSNGSFVWAKQFGNSTPGRFGRAVGYSIKIDGAGNVFTSGHFADTVDFDPGPGVYNLYGGFWWGVGGLIYVSKLDSSGNLLWARAPELATISWAEANGAYLDVDGAGNVYCTGEFDYELDFDPGPGVSVLSATDGDIYIWKLTANGLFSWVKQIENEQGHDIKVDSAGNIYTSGYFGGTVDFDPGPGTCNLTADSSGHFYLLKLTSDGIFIWAKRLNGFITYKLALDASGNTYTTGGSFSSVDVDPGPGVYNLIGPCIYITKLNSDGNFIWAKQLDVYGSRDFTQIYSVAFDDFENVYSVGIFHSMIDFDPGSATYNLTPNGFTDAFVHKMGPCANSASILSQPLSQNICSGATAVFSVSATNATAFQWQLSTNSGVTYTDIAGATSPSYTITSVTTSQNNYRYRCRVTGACNEVLTSAAILSTSSTVISAQPQSISLCAGSNHTFSVVALGTSTYQWQSSTDGGTSFNDITGANSSSYTIASVATTQDGYQFRCIVTGQCDTVTSYTALLSVTGPVSILVHPASTEVCAGGNAIFLVSTNSTQTFSYQWEVSTNGGTSYLPVINGGIYSGATSSLLTITTADGSLNKNLYRCVLSNAICNFSTTSNTAILNVRKLPEIRLAAAPFTSLFPWQSTTLTATPIGSGGVLSTVWIYNNSIVPNTGNTRQVNFDQIGTYQVRIQERWPSDLVCSNWSNIIIKAQDTARLIIYPNPNNGQFKISYYNPSGVNNLQVATVYDSKGAMVYRKGFNVTGIYTLVDINMVPMPAGFYSVVISDTKGERIAVGKLIVY